MNVLLIGLLCSALAGADARQGSCGDLAAELEEEMDRSALAMEPESGLAAIYEKATEAAEPCPDDEGIAYLRLRSAELGRGAPVGRQAAPISDEWRKLAPILAARFPKSARIATIQARASRSVADARKASALDPKYIPARVALAAALLPSSAAEAVTYLTPAHDLATVSDGYTVLARARWDLGDAAGAIEAANLALHGRALRLVEPDARDPRPLSGAHEVLGQALLAKGRFRQAATHLKLAAPDSALARKILADPPAGLRKVLRSP